MSLTPEQIALREFRVGASEIAGLLPLFPQRGPLGPDNPEPLHPYKDPLSIYMDRIGATGGGGVWLGWGSRMERPILEDYAEGKGYTLIWPGDEYPKSIVHPRWPAFVVSLDVIAEDDDGCRRVADAKNVTGEDVREWGAEATDAGPDYYRAQLIVQEGVASECGLSDPEGDLVACLAGRAPQVFPVEFNEAVLEALHEVAAKFVRDCLIPKKPPEGWEGFKRAQEFVKARWQKHQAELREPSLRAVRAWRQLQFAKKRGERWERVAQMAQAVVCDEIGDAAGMHGVATWKADKRGVRTLRPIKGGQAA